MSLKSDKWIIDKCSKQQMITPYFDCSINKLDNYKVVSYGVSSYGYDIRCSNEFKLIDTSNIKNKIGDPKQENVVSDFIEIKATNIIIPPNSLLLTTSVETFKIPSNVMGICIGKSTYARLGIVANITPLEAGWKGQLTIELSNTSSIPVRIYAFEGIAQILFFESDEQCSVSYANRDGKYQNQIGITESKV